MAQKQIDEQDEDNDAECQCQESLPDEICYESTDGERKGVNCDNKRCNSLPYTRELLWIHTPNCVQPLFWSQKTKTKQTQINMTTKNKSKNKQCPCKNKIEERQMRKYCGILLCEIQRAKESIKHDVLRMFHQKNYHCC